MADFRIDSELQSFMPKQDADARKRLKSLIDEGRHVDPGVVLNIDGDRVLGDGYTRLSICEELDIDFPTREIEISTREEAIQWICDNQLGRRNLTDEQRAYYLGKKYLAERKAKDDTSRLSSPSAKFADGKNIGDNEKSETAAKIAAEQKVSTKTVYNNAKFAEAVDAMPEEEKQKVLAGDSGKTKQEIIDEHRPIRCKNCARKGADNPDCQACQELRKKKTKSKPKQDDPKEDPEEEPKDRAGDPWPARCLPIVTDTAKELDAFRRQVLNLIAESRRLHNATKVANHVDLSSVTHSLEQIKTMCLAGKPEYVCPYCDGTGKTREQPICKPCKGDGWVNQSIYTNSPKAAERRRA